MSIELIVLSHSISYIYMNSYGASSNSGSEFTMGTELVIVSTFAKDMRKALDDTASHDIQLISEDYSR